MLKNLRQMSIIQYKKYTLIHKKSYSLIYILKYSSAFIVLRVRLTKYQQIYSDVPLAAQKMFTYLFAYLLEPI